VTERAAGTDSTWRSVGFLVLMVGLGLRLDTRWQGFAWMLIVLGAAGGGVGLWLLNQRSGRSASSGGTAASAFVPPGGKG
jgi:hypothetical protein